MNIITKEEFLNRKAHYFQQIKNGAVFIYPTDTIYGIGADATSEAAVERIRSIKQRTTAPFSVAVPSKEWIEQNCELLEPAREWLKKLPGPYTFLLKLKNKEALAKSVHPQSDIVGIRIPDNWFSSQVSELGVPVVSTSANITTQSHMTSLEDANPLVTEKVDFIIYEGKKGGRPSTIVSLWDGSAQLKER